MFIANIKGWLLIVAGIGILAWYFLSSRDDKMVDTQTCGRRMLDWGPWEHTENLDYWHQDDTCSFCGSLKPDLVLEWMRTGQCSLGPTDKNYKMYVEPNNGHEVKGAHKFYFQHFSEEQMQTFIELYNMRPRPFAIDYPGYFYVKPFFCASVPREEVTTDGAN